MNMLVKKKNHMNITKLCDSCTSCNYCQNLNLNRQGCQVEHRDWGLIPATPLMRMSFELH